MIKPEISFIHPTELQKKYSFLANKRLGQHFLVHRPILETITRKALESKPHTVLEVGPGPGTLSQLIAPQVDRLLLIEKDNQFKPLLEEVILPLGKVEIRIEDFLKSNLEKLIDSKNDQPAIAVGNLPYNASVAILKKLLEHRALFSRFYLMFQREVADRLTAKPSTKAYGSLTVYCQMLAEMKLVLPIPPSAFSPRPKVNSAVVEIIPFHSYRYPEIDFDLFEQLIQAAFKTRRKTLLNSLLSEWSKAFKKSELEEILKNIQIDPQRRGETLSLEEFTNIAECLKNMFFP